MQYNMVFSQSGDEKCNFNAKFIKIRAVENRLRVMRLKDFDEFLTEVGVAQMGIFFNQMEGDAIYQLYSTSLFFPTTLYLSPNTV